MGQTDSKMDYSHDITHGMKKLRLQAQKRLQATLLTDDSSGKSDKMKIKLPNPKFIFHNKIPKSGSTTLANIVHTLEERNRFKLRHFHPCVNERKYINVQFRTFGPVGPSFFLRFQDRPLKPLLSNP